MTAPRRPGNRQPTPGPNTALLRGALLVGVAVVLGLALLAKGFPTGGGGSSPDQSSTTASTTPGSETSSTVASPHQPSQVKVLVLNGSGLIGVAGGATDILNGKGYTTGDPGNAAQDVAASVIYYVETFQADAASIATALGLPTTAVRPLPAAGTEPSLPADLQGASVVVVLGPDYRAG